MIELSDTNASGIATELVRSRTRAGFPVMGMVLTLVIVVTEDQAPSAMEAAQAASNSRDSRSMRSRSDSGGMTSFGSTLNRRVGNWRAVTTSGWVTWAAPAVITVS